MQNDGQSEARAVIPRWRSLSKTNRRELASTKIRQSGALWNTAYLSDALAKYENSPSKVNAVEVINSAFVANQPDQAITAARAILHENYVVNENITAAAWQILGMIEPKADVEIDNFGRQPSSSLIRHLARLKAKLVNDPRDALTAIEVARIQTLTGQSKSAERYINTAIKMLPNNRYILRSAARYFTFMNKTDQALDLIWKSDAVKGDIWVQSAEVALADLCDKSPKWGHKHRQDILSSRVTTTAMSELSIGLATLEHKNGGKRRFIRSLASKCIESGTENALAQAIWLDQRANLQLDENFHLIDRPDAKEALAISFLNKEDYEKSVGKVWEWINDQPFSPRSYLMGASCSCIYLADYKQALTFANLGLNVHTDHAGLLNSKLISQAYLGRISDAEMTFSALSEFANDKEILPYINAADGLIDFLKGQYDTGREKYVNAIQNAKKSDSSNLSLNACIYWLEQEVRFGFLNADSWSIISSQVEKQINKHKNKEIVKIWKSRIKIINNMITQNNFFVGREINKIDGDKLLTQEVVASVIF